MNLDSKIYVAGHRGLVGSAIMRKLKEKGYTNLVKRTSRQLDLRNQGATERFFKKEKPEYVFLAAAKVGGVLANDTYKAEFIYDNTMIASNVIHASYEYGVKKLLNLGSSCIYPKFSNQPMKEEYLLTGELEPTNEPYAIAKISAIKLCRYYNEQYGTNFISVMPTNLYGPNDNFNLETSHVLAALIRKFHLAKLLTEKKYDEIRKDMQKFPLGFNLKLDLNLVSDSDIVNLLAEVGIRVVDPSLNTQHSTPNTLHSSPNALRFTVVMLWGTGNPYREFLFVDDLAEATVFLMNNYDAMRYTPGALPDFINIGTGKDIAIKDLAEMVKEIVGFEGEIQWDTTKPDGTPRKLLDISKIDSLGWKPNVKLEDGIKKTYNWYLSKS